MHTLGSNSNCIILRRLYTNTTHLDKEHFSWSILAKECKATRFLAVGTWKNRRTREKYRVENFVLFPLLLVTVHSLQLNHDDKNV
jgi:hypothetical protein